jgi:predicted nucleotidyltransferase
MRANLLAARDDLRKKLINNANRVILEIQQKNPENLIEIGLFGSLTKDKFTCTSDADIYLIFEGAVPDRLIKGQLREIAEENNCDIVFITEDAFTSKNPELLVKEILKSHYILWRKN